MKKLGYILLVFAIIWTAVIWSFSLKNADASNSQSESITETLETIIEDIIGEDVELNGGKIRKMAHFAEFCLLGALVFLTFFCMEVKKGVLYAFSCLWPLGAAVTDELLQLLSDGRSAQFSDVMIDFSGSLTAVGILTLLTFKKFKYK